MTSNERKILECIRNHGGEVHTHLISNKLGFSSGYGQYLCHTLKKAGHLEFTERNFCRLSEKGHEYLQNRGNIGVIAVSSLPQEEPTGGPALSDNGDELGEEENQEKESEDGNADQSVKDEELDKVLADLNPIPEKNESEKIDKTEELKEAGPRAMMESTEIGEEKKVETQESGKTEVKPAESAPEQARYGAGNPAPAVSSESSEKAAPKEEPAKPNGGFGMSFKKIVGWFAEKK